MKIKDRAKLYDCLIIAAGWHKMLSMRFQEFRANVHSMEQADFPLKGIKVKDEGEAACLVSFSGSTVKLRFVFDRQKGRGLIVAEQVKSDSSEQERVYVYLFGVPFGGDGNMDLEPRDGAGFSTHSETDCREIALTALDVALDKTVPIPPNP